MTTLVIGATGMLGGEICRLLAEQRRSVRALVRETSNPDRVAAQYSAATDPLQKSFAALMLYTARGNVIDMNETVRAFSVPQLTSVREQVEGAASFGAAV